MVLSTHLQLGHKELPVVVQQAIKGFQDVRGSLGATAEGGTCRERDEDERRADSSSARDQHLQDQLTQHHRLCLS